VAVEKRFVALQGARNPLKKKVWYASDLKGRVSETSQFRYDDISEVYMSF
jgi:hypothetical protein